MQLPLQLHSAAVVLEFINFISEFPFFLVLHVLSIQICRFHLCFGTEMENYCCHTAALPPTFYFMAHSLRVGFKY